MSAMRRSGPQRCARSGSSASYCWVVDTSRHSSHSFTVSNTGIYTKPPPHFRDVTEDEIRGLATFCRSSLDHLSSDEVVSVRGWLDCAGAFAMCCLSISDADYYAVLACLKYVVESGELFLAKNAAARLALFERDRQWLVGVAVAWMTNPRQSIAHRPWRFPYIGGVMVEKDRSDVESELATSFCYAGASLADDLVQSAASTPAEREVLLDGMRRAVIPLNIPTAT